jgi:cellulose synthase/poly-beta-1,6-N-acetylglucosamine synthase-like glycosyltransferase
MKPPIDPHALLASVIVPVFDGAQTLDACLRALSAQTIGSDRYDVIVVDDGSTDDSAHVAARHEVTAIRQDHTGAAAARNRGAKQARGQVLLYTDADCEPLPDWVEQMLAPFADPEVMGVKGVYRTRQRASVARFVQAEFEEKYDRQKRMAQIDFVDTYAAAYRREVLTAHGGFDPAFLMDEDQEFSFRLAGAGYRLVFQPTAGVYHQHPSSVWEYAWRKVQFGRWKVRVIARHPSKALHDSYTPWTQKAQIVLLPLAGVAVIVAAFGLLSWPVALIPALAGLLSAAPLLARTARQGPEVLMLAPLLILIRALALGLGLAWGVGSQVRGLVGGQWERDGPPEHAKSRE